MKLISFLFTFAAALGFASAAGAGKKATLSEALRGSMKDRAEQRTLPPRTIHRIIDRAATRGVLPRWGVADLVKSYVGGFDCGNKIPNTHAKVASMDTTCFEWGACPDPTDAAAMNRLVVSVLI